ncbi:hypothetical protein ACQP2T_31060 [Nonomuraea sp. CA-143628]|uniref:alpha/beta hydrolase n=1 Tax=Nonomuraea sp. CA-143628 TaxID=3239997 RepID=UPI003D8E73CF
MSSRHTGVAWGSALVAGLALAGVLTATAPAVAADQAKLTAPTLTGRYDVGTTDLHLIDPSRADPWKPERRRELMVTLTYPADRFAEGPRAPWLTPGMSTVIDQALAGEDYLELPAGSIDWASAKRRAKTGVPVAHGAPKPVALFSPGFGFPRETYTAIVDDLASRGYVVVSLSHTYESAAVEFPDGRLELAVSEGEEPELKKALDARVADSRFVLNQQPLMLGMDGAEHAAARRSVIGEFTVRRVAALRPRVQDIKFNAVTLGEATNMNIHTGELTVTEGSDPIIELATLASDGPTGIFIDRLGPITR